MNKLKIAIINATGGGISGGYREYLRNIIPIMASHDDVEEILCAAPESLNVQELFSLTDNVKVVSCKPVRFLCPFRDLPLLDELEAFSPNVIFVPVERSFRFRNIPVVNMIQNMEAFLPNIKGNSISERMRQRIQCLEGKRALKRADSVIAPSQFVVDFLSNRLNIPNEKISLIYYGVRTKQSDDNYRPSVIPKSWANRFIFTAGSIRPARGLDDILNALNHLASSSPGGEKLVIAGNIKGPKISNYQQRLLDRIKKNKLADRVCWAGSLNEKEMAWCYQNCGIFVMTSRVESFGMIAAEAMAHGCVCISADNPCLPEIFGDAAIYYQPKNGNYLADLISTGLSWSNSKRKEVSARAKMRAAKFSWDACAEQTIAHLSSVANRNV